MNMQEYIDQLNPQQREAVMINDGSLLVFAGAGSGKTRVITTKIAYAIQELGIRPYQILAVTFTNRACKEMQDRVIEMAGDAGRSVMIRTFHSFGVWLLRKYGSRVGLDENFKIYDDEESVTLLCQCFPNDNKKEIAGYYKKISVLRDKMESPNRSDERLCRYYDKYNEVLRRTGNVDFADMILKSIDLLRNNSDVKQYVQNRFRMILVDEYQDSNKAQFLLLKELVGPETFICAVGDDDQSIYRFRGAEVRNILDFPKAFPNTRKVVLGTNYRCTENILNAARDVIGHNTTRADKDLNAAKRGGMMPKLVYVEYGSDEAQRVVNILKKAHDSDPDAYCRSAIIYRTNAQSKDFEDRLMLCNVPYHLVGSLRFYDREEIRDCIAMISLMSNPRDTVAFQRMINKPARKVGAVSIEKLLDAAANDGSSDGNVIESSRKAISQGIVRGQAVAGVQEFLRAYDNCRSLFGTVDNGRFLKQVLLDFGILEYYMMRDKDEKLKVNKRTENIEQLVNMLSMEQFCNGQEGVNSFLEFSALDPSSLGDDEGRSDEGVTLITMHNTKGLEYDRVFLVGMEDEIFPGRRDDRRAEDIEEERRICYVAMTRARKELYMFSASSRLRWGSVQPESPSMFISEIDPSHIETEDYRLRSRDGKAGDDGYRFRFEGGYGYGSYGGSSYGTSSYGRRSDGSGFNPDRSADRYSSNYINTNQRGKDYDEPSRQGSPAGKYNIRNSNVRLVKGASTEAAKAPAAKPKTAGSMTYEVGERIKSEFYGPGVITGKRNFAGREVLDVRFDSGRTGSFASDKVAFEKI